jgi:multidrug transporter EmrE-like cation transporter
MLLAFVGPLAKYLPLAVISGLLMVVAWGLIDRREIAHLWHQGASERVPLDVTTKLLGCVRHGAAVSWFAHTERDAILRHVSAVADMAVVEGEGGVACYGTSLLLWLLALTRVEMSYGVPLLSLSYVLTTVVGAFFFKEALPVWRLVGLGLIMGGIYCVARTSPN